MQKGAYAMPVLAWVLTIVILPFALLMVAGSAMFLFFLVPLVWGRHIGTAGASARTGRAKGVVDGGGPAPYPTRAVGTCP